MKPTLGNTGCLVLDGLGGVNIILITVTQLEASVAALGAVSKCITPVA
jgi:hypothetical protein